MKTSEKSSAATFLESGKQLKKTKVNQSEKNHFNPINFNLNSFCPRNARAGKNIE